MLERSLGHLQALKLKRAIAMSSAVNWLCEAISGDGLNKLGFATVKEDGQFLTIGDSKPNPNDIANIDDADITEVYHYKPLDLVVIKRKHSYIMALDSYLDSFWRKELTNLKDVVSLMCLLT